MFSILFVSVFLISCEIVQEIEFNEQGGGTYSLGFDMSEMMKMGMSSKDSTQPKQVDTLINFSNYLKEKKDSIRKLPKAEREKIAQLEAFNLYMKADTTTNQLIMKMGYKFENLKDLKLFSKKLEGQNIKELAIFKEQLKDKKSKNEDNTSEFPDFNEAFDMVFSKTSFSHKITKDALVQAEKDKDTTLKKDSPMANMIRFKQRFKFPYKINKVTNEKAKILSDFKGIEIEGNMYDINNTPTIFDLEVFFDH